MASAALGVLNVPAIPESDKPLSLSLENKIDWPHRVTTNAPWRIGDLNGSVQLIVLNRQHVS